MQSINVGLSEASELASILKKILRERGSLNLLEAYNRDRRNEWQQLLGIKSRLNPRTQAAPWTRERAARILSCIPASGEDLKHLAAQVELDFQSTGP
jgi:2-polyprenyl-6-methoxyphenol hydroxylase-like FAD-dependent oxidoreductase